ncbi:MAG: DivIVA domain-containing protein [Gaiellaceae bacterium]
MQDPPSTPQLRRTWAGYRVADVDLLLAQFGSRVSQLWSESQSLSSRLEQVESQRAELELRLGEAHKREIELVRKAGRIHAECEQELDAARDEAGAILDEARLDVARLRGDAALQAETARAQVDELLRLRDTLSATMRVLIRDFEALVGCIDRGESPPASARPHAAPAPPAAEPATSTANGDVFDGHVELDAGPFNDFASLSAFERALGSLPKIEDVYIRRFDGDRATIELTLLEPASLIDEMTARLPYRLDVERSDLDHIAVTVSDAG